MGVSTNRGSRYSTLNTRILIVRTPKQGTPIFGNSHVEFTRRMQSFCLSVRKRESESERERDREPERKK